MKESGGWDNERNKIREKEDNDRMGERMTIFSSKDSFSLILLVLLGPSIILIIAIFLFHDWSMDRYETQEPWYLEIVRDEKGNGRFFVLVMIFLIIIVITKRLVLIIR